MRKVTTNLGQVVQTALRGIEQANPHVLFGIFGHAQWTNRDRLSNAMLRDLIGHFSTLELTVANLPEDELGQSYKPSGARSTAAGCLKGERGGAHQYLIKKFADDSGHTVAEPVRSGDRKPQTARRTNEIRAKEGSLTITHYVGGETQAQTDAAAKSAATALPEALTGWLESSKQVRQSLQMLLSTK